MVRVRPDCIRVPTSPTPSDYVPPDSVRRPVAEGESFLSIANALGINPAWQLIHFNFPSVGPGYSARAAAEVNWHLETTLGCSAVTADSKNYKFHSGMRRPYIYIPVGRIDMPGSTVGGSRPRPEPTLLWYGGGMKNVTGGMVSSIAYENVHGVLFSDDDLSRHCAAGFMGRRHGLNLGLGGAGAVLFVATGVREPRQLHGYKLDGFDFSVQLGPVAKSVGLAFKHHKAARILGKLGTRALLTMTEREELRDILKAALGASGIDIKSRTPQFHVIDVPFASLGLDASLYYLEAQLQIDGAPPKPGG